MKNSLDTKDTARYTYETKEQVIDAARCFGQAEYFQSCKNIAQDAMDENPDDEDAQNDYLHESVDGSYWIIYTARILDVLHGRRSGNSRKRTPFSRSRSGPCWPIVGTSFKNSATMPRNPKTKTDATGPQGPLCALSSPLWGLERVERG